MSPEDYKKCARDILSNKIALQGWIPMFVMEESDLPSGGSSTLAEIMDLLAPFALDSDQSPVDTLKRVLDRANEVPPPAGEPKQAESLPLGKPNLEAAVEECISNLSTQKLRALAKQRGIDVSGKTRPEMIAILNTP